jgi:hypothetical protein
MWEILNRITPSDRPRPDQDPRRYYDQIANKRVDEVFPPGEMNKLPDLTQQPVQHVDATPNEEYPLRILRAYRQHCDCNWAETTDGQEATNPLLVMMNEQNRQRAVILDRAIRLLEAHRGRGARTDGG